MFDYNWWVFHPRGDLSLLNDTQHIFSLPFESTVRLCWTLSYLTEPTQSTPKAVLIYQRCTHTHLMPCPMHMQCSMPLHVISCHMHNKCYTDTQSTPLTRCHRQSHHLHMDFYTSFHSYQYITQAYINIHIQHVIL